MFNYLLKRLYEEYSVNRSNDRVEFLKKEKIVATLYPKEQVLNIFLSASPDVVWNHDNLAIFVIAKKYGVLNNGKFRKTEATWLIGSLGATHDFNLKSSLYLETSKPLDSEDISVISRCYKGKHKTICFDLFNLEIEWKESKESHSHIKFLNPALVYPVKHGGQKIHNPKTFLKERYKWEYGPGFNTVGSSETREFIDTLANNVNHTSFSQIQYRKK